MYKSDDSSTWWPSDIFGRREIELWSGDNCNTIIATFNELRLNIEGLYNAHFAKSDYTVNIFVIIYYPIYSGMLCKECIVFENKWNQKKLKVWNHTMVLTNRLNNYAKNGVGDHHI